MSGTVLDIADQLRNKSHFLSSRGLLTRRKETDIHTEIFTLQLGTVLEKMKPNGDLMDTKGFIR